MRVMVYTKIVVSQDDEQRQKLLDFENTYDDSDDTTASTWASGQLVLAPSASAVEYPFGGVTNAAFVLIVASQECKVQVNSNSAPLVEIPVVPAVTGGSILSQFQTIQNPGIWLLRTNVQSLFFTNPSSALPATVFVALVGESS
jgi:hypothetical protein